MENRPGSYVLLLNSVVNEPVLIGKYKTLDLIPGYYTYCGSAFGPGGIVARVQRHLKLKKKKHWHIDYLRDKCTIEEIWVSYFKENTLFPFYFKTNNFMVKLFGKDKKDQT